MAVIALAGRRTDAPDAANVRFPPANVDIVKERIRRHLERLTARTLVCSAACGADLVALDAAGEHVAALEMQEAIAGSGGTGGVIRFRAEEGADAVEDADRGGLLPCHVARIDRHHGDRE